MGAWWLASMWACGKNIAYFFAVFHATIFTYATINAAPFCSGQPSTFSQWSTQHSFRSNLYACIGQHSTFSQWSTQNSFRSNLYACIGQHNIFFAVVHATIFMYGTINAGPFWNGEHIIFFAVVHTTIFTYGTVNAALFRSGQDSTLFAAVNTPIFTHASVNAASLLTVVNATL